METDVLQQLSPSDFWEITDLDRYAASSTPRHNQWRVLFSSERLNLPVLRQAVYQVVQRHEMLRTLFVSKGGIASLAFTGPPTLVDFEFFRIDNCELRTAESMAHALIAPKLVRHFDLFSGPTACFTAIDLAGKATIVAFVTPSACADAFSISIFFKELEYFYREFEAGRPAQLLPPASQYRQWIGLTSGAALLEHTQQLEHWRAMVRHPGSSLEVSNEVPKPRSDPSMGAISTPILSTETLRELQDSLARQAVGFVPTIYTVCAAVIARWRFTTESCIWIGYGGRSSRRFSGAVGPFSFAFPIHSQFEANRSLTTEAASFSAKLKGSQEHFSFPSHAMFSLLPRDAAGNIVPSVMVVLMPDTAHLVESPSGLFTKTLLFPQKADLGSGCIWGLKLIFRLGADGLWLSTQHSLRMVSPDTALHIARSISATIQALAKSASVVFSHSALRVCSS